MAYFSTCLLKSVKARTSSPSPSQPTHPPMGVKRTIAATRKPLQALNRNTNGRWAPENIQTRKRTEAVTRLHAKLTLTVTGNKRKTRKQE